MTVEELVPRLESLESQMAASPHSGEEATQIKQRVAELVATIEAAQRKADDEALRAYNAKVLCEEHAKATATTRGQVEVEFTAINATKTKCEDAERALNASRTAADESIAVITSSREALQNAQAWVSQNLPTLESNAQTISSSKSTSDTLLQESTRANSQIKTALDETTRDKDRIAISLEQVVKAKVEVEAAALKAVEAKTATEADRGTAAKRLEELEHVTAELKKRHEEVTKYKTNLDDMAAVNRALNEKVESLLPHASSAGLASAFREQKARFKKPQKYWLWTFVATVFVLFVIAVPDFWRELAVVTSPADATISWDYLLRHFIRRLPLVVPLVWLAIYAGRNYTMAVRLEEDYAYKEAVSTAFEGYKREMATIPVTSAGIAPLYALCNNVLDALAQRPGRIYEGEHHDVTPATPVLAALEKILRKKEVETKPTPPAVVP